MAKASRKLREENLTATTTQGVQNIKDNDNFM
jgi:hypothetical protein